MILDAAGTRKLDAVERPALQLLEARYQNCLHRLRFSLNAAAGLEVSCGVRSAPNTRR
jgi:hypothetical protein